MNKKVCACAALAPVWFLTGCASTTIDFAEPAGADLSIRGLSYKMPAAVRLRQRTPYYQAVGAYDFIINIPDRASPGGVLPAYGRVYVYQTPLSDVDRLARNFFRIPKEKIDALKEGAAVTIEGYSADGGKRLYRAVVGLRKPESVALAPAPPGSP